MNCMCGIVWYGVLWSKYKVLRVMESHKNPLCALNINIVFSTFTFPVPYTLHFCWFFCFVQLIYVEHRASNIERAHQATKWYCMLVVIDSSPKCWTCAYTERKTGRAHSIFRNLHTELRNFKVKMKMNFSSRSFVFGRLLPGFIIVNENFRTYDTAHFPTELVSAIEKSTVTQFKLNFCLEKQKLSDNICFSVDLQP